MYVLIFDSGYCKKLKNTDFYSPRVYIAQSLLTIRVLVVTVYYYLNRYTENAYIG